MSRNNGIIMNGGTLTTRDLAVGEGATINLTPEVKVDLNNNVVSILIALEAQKSNIDNYEEVKKFGEIVKKELIKEQPDKNMLANFISMIPNAVREIPNITLAIKGIKETMDLLL